MSEASSWTFASADAGGADELPYADCTLAAGGDDSMARVHKGVLATFSRSLAASLASAAPKATDIVLAGATKPQLDLLVGWMYRTVRASDFTLDTVMQLCALGKEYGIPLMLRDADEWLTAEVAADRLLKPFEKEAAPPSSVPRTSDYLRLWPTVFPGEAEPVISTRCVICICNCHYSNQQRSEKVDGEAGTLYNSYCGHTFTLEQWLCQHPGASAKKAALDAAFAKEQSAAAAAAAAPSAGPNKANAAAYAVLLRLARVYKLARFTRAVCERMEALQAAHAQLVLLAYVLADLQ